MQFLIYSKYEEEISFLLIFWLPTIKKPLASFYI